MAAIVVGFAVVVVALKASIPAAPTALIPANPVPATARGESVGVAGCAAAACHGAPSAGSLTGLPSATCWQSAATHWAAADPHTRAYAALESELAAGMMARLGRKHSATRDAACLCCHTTPALADSNPDPGAELVARRAEGVGCEACHENAGSWLREHTTWTAANRAERYTATGMAKLYDPGERAMVCAGCHVGGVNHDLLAAGHPRLNFDLAEYQRRLPPHWQEKDRTTSPPVPRGPWFGVQLWAVGRVAVAEAACRLTAGRAGRGPWPEFAEFNCSACHHNLSAGWREKLAVTDGRPAGTAPWQTLWPATRPADLAAWDVAGAREAADAMESLLAVFRQPRQPGTGHVQPAALAAVGRLAALRTALTRLSDRDVARLVLRSIDRVAESDRPLDWDEACQATTELAAIERARLGFLPEARRISRPEFAAVFGRLTLPRPPHDRYDSPRDYDPDETGRALAELARAVRDAVVASPDRP